MLKACRKHEEDESAVAKAGAQLEALMTQAST
jgi:hypothetical protein